MTDIQKINAEAKSAFDNKDYSLAFQTLWKVGVVRFVAFAQKKELSSKVPSNKKNNWFSHPQAGEFFWRDFVLEKEIFEAIFNSESATQLLHNYFSISNIQSPEFESRLANKFPTIYIQAVRVNQVFLKQERIEYLCLNRLDKSFQIHQKIWRKIFDIEQSQWKGIQEELISVSKYSLNDILSHCIIWLETIRFNDNNQDSIHHLASVYSFFIELILNTYPDEAKEQKNSDDFFKQFLEVFASSYKDKTVIEEGSVSKLLSRISHWIAFKEEVISPYSFDLNIEPIQENELVFFNSTPEAYYKWKLNGVRYGINQTNYIFQGSSCVEYLESENKLIIPKGRTPEDENINRTLAGFKWGTLLLLRDLGIDFFLIGNNKIEVDKLLSPLLAYSFNRLSRYENSLQKHIAGSNNWNEAFFKLINESIKTDIIREPYFLMTENEYKKLNQTALSQIPEDSTQEVVQLFRYKPNKRYEFNRFRTNYDVWQKPFIKIADNLFCPMLFFANNIWFYSFAQEGLRQSRIKGTERNETRLMENHLGEIIKQKGWSVKVISDKEANEIDGDIDVFVEDQNTLLFIQLKRTYFRLNLKDAYYDSIYTDKSAAKQLKDAENYLEQDNSIYNIKHKPFKWIVSTSFENIGDKINGCSKINYFELLNALKNPEVKNLSDLVSHMQSDKNLKNFVSSVFDENLPIEVREIIAEVIRPLGVFEPKQYKQVMFTDDEKKTEDYNALFNNAIKLGNEGKTNEALILFQQCISQNPNDGEVYSALANTLANMKMFDSSFLVFMKALELIPNDPYISRNYSLALMEAGKVYEGLVVAIKLLGKFPMLGDIRILFEKNFENSLKSGLLNPEQIIELQTKWNNMN